MTARDDPTPTVSPMTSPQSKGAGASTALPGGARQATPGSQIVVEHVSPIRAAIGRFFRHRLAIVGLVIIAFVLFTAIFADFLTTWNPNFVDLDLGSRVAPSGSHILGTDVSGRDIFSRTLYGGRTSLIVGFGAVSVYLIVGTLLGLASGFYGGVVDMVLMRFTDTIMAIPTLLLIIVFAAILGPSILTVIAVIGMLNWGPTARLVRGQLLVLREAEFITAAKVVGVSDRTILFRHMLPNVFGPLTVVATFGVASAVILEATLSFLGLGVQEPSASWGNMISVATDPIILSTVWWQWVPPAFMITITVLGVNFIGDGLRDALDPKTVKKG